jgi:hypothetical protein
MSDDVEERRRNPLTEEHVRLMIAEITMSLLKDQKTHLTSYADKLKINLDEKYADKYTVLSERLGKAETQSELNAQSIHRIDRKVEMWVNRGVGVWALAITLFALVEYGTRFAGK